MNTKIIFLSLLMAACTPSKSVLPSTHGAQESLFGQYQIQQLGERQLSPSEQENAQILLDKTGRASANLGCNQIFARIEIKEPAEIRFQDMGSTRMACPEEHIEAEFSRLLAEVNRYQFATQHTLFLQKDKVILMKLQRVKN